MVSIVPLQRRPASSSSSSAAARSSIFSLERRRREDDDDEPGAVGMDMDLSGTQGELAIPMHHANASSPYAGGGGHVLQQLHRDHGCGSNHGQQSPAAEETTESSAGKKRGGPTTAGIIGSSPAVVRYRECLKNHAAAIGGNATDGCGEFMPSGEEGSLEALKCSACGCHRNFHRKAEVHDDDDDDMLDDPMADGFTGHGHHGHHRLLHPAAMAAHHKAPGGGGLMISGADPYGAYAAARALPPAMPVNVHHGHHHQHHQYVMPLSMMLHSTSESDEMEVGGGGGGGSSSAAAAANKNKRFRTKFTVEQKARMLEFAERVGWRLQRLDDAMVQAFCQEIGVRRRVLKVWMHNNKHNLATKRLGLEAAATSPPAMQDQAMASPLQQHMPLQMPAGVMPPPPPPLPPPASSAQLAGPSSSCHRGGPGSPMPLKLE